MMYVIAEIGVNHNGSAEIADRLIEKAANCGADAVKFQHFKAEKLASVATPKVKYQLSTSDPTETHRDMLKSLEITDEIEQVGLRRCKELGLDFISTPYDPDAVEHLLSLGCKYIKTASADIVDHRIHKLIAKSNARAIIATGMATLEEINACLDIYQCSHNKPILLHCVSNYPCSDESLNLRVLVELANTFNIDVGFSDHSIGSNAVKIAYTLGARYFEKHFTLDKSMPGPDHLASSTPDEFKQLILDLKQTEIMLGNPQKHVQIEEMQMRDVSRKSAHAIRTICKGHIVTADDITMLRPGNGICGAGFFELIGKRAIKSIPQGQKINFGDIE